jgi:hypothetical protein
MREIRKDRESPQRRGKYWVGVIAKASLIPPVPPFLCVSKILDFKLLDES